MVSSLVLDSNQRKTVLQTVLLTSLATRHLVRVKGLEPPRLSASDPKSDVSTISPHPQLEQKTGLEPATFSLEG